MSRCYCNNPNCRAYDNSKPYFCTACTLGKHRNPVLASTMLQDMRRCIAHEETYKTFDGKRCYYQPTLDVYEIPNLKFAIADLRKEGYKVDLWIPEEPNFDGHKYFVKVTIWLDKVIEAPINKREQKLRCLTCGDILEVRMGNYCKYCNPCIGNLKYDFENDPPKPYNWMI